MNRQRREILQVDEIPDPVVHTERIRQVLDDAVNHPVADLEKTGETAVRAFFESKYVVSKLNSPDRVRRERSGNSQ